MLNKQIFSKVAGISVAASLAIAGTANTAQALDFSFSFDDTVGNNPGTVSGKIFGLADDATGQQPTSVRIDSAPASLGLTTPLTFSGSDYIGSSTGFEVATGAISNANVLYSNGNEALRLNFKNQNRLTNSTTTEYSLNTGGFSGATYSASTTPTAVPFGVSPNMGIVILGGMYGASRLRKKLAAK